MSGTIHPDPEKCNPFFEKYFDFFELFEIRVELLNGAPLSPPLLLAGSGDFFGSALRWGGLPLTCPLLP
jgi:hypothetical protein